MKSSSKIGLLLVILTLGLLLSACGDGGSISTGLSPVATTASQAGTTTSAATTTSGGITTAPATTVAVTTVPATTVVPTTAAPVSTTVAVTTAVPTTVASTTKAVSTTASAPANSIRQTGWLKVLQNDPQLVQEPPVEPFKIFISIKGVETVTGAPDLDNIVYVDVDKDGLEEAAIPLISGGTAGNIGFLLYRYAQPAPRLVGFQEGYKQSLKAVDGKLVATNAVYSGWEPNCCPSGYSTITYSLTGDKLQVASSRTDGYVEAQPPTVREFYDLIGVGELIEAYKFLSPNYQKANPYNKWAAGFATTQKVTADTVADTSASNTVRVKLESTDSTNGGGQVVKHYSGTWKVVWSAERNGWLLDEPKIQEVTGTNASTAKLLPLFEVILDDLKKRTNLPIFLPTTFDDILPGVLFAYTDRATLNSYIIGIDYEPACKGANACRYGSLTGRLVAALTPISGQKVSLTGGITGYFTDASCGASCGDSTLSWEQGGVRYTVGVKAAKLDTLVKIANSAITNGPV